MRFYPFGSSSLNQTYNNTIGRIDRDKFINYKNKENIFKDKTILIRSPFIKNVDNLNVLINFGCKFNSIF